MNQAKGSLTTSLLFLFFHFCISIDTITPTQFIKDGDILVSKGERFALGFFSPGTSTRRYVGIWYNKVSEQTVVWVGNRDNPVNDASGVLTINSQGNLVLYEKNQTIPLWSTNFSTSTSNSMAQLQDSGNLVLLQRDTERFLWQSFDYPTDTLLPNMKLGLNTRTGKNWVLTSWKSKDDPGTGDIVYRIDPSGVPQLFLYKGSVRWWRGGPWTGERWSGVPEMTRNYIFNVSFVNNKGEVSIAYGLTNPSLVSRMMFNESGNVQRATWNQRDHRWIGFWSAPKEQCDNYGECGANSNCDPYDSDSFICKCLPGFEPKSPRDWYLRDGSGGCIRKAGVSTCQSGEGFVKMERVRVPDTTKAQADMNLSLKVCEQECLKNCSCTAYTSADERGFGCMRWYGDLVDTRTYSSVGQDIYVRVDAAELGISLFCYQLLYYIYSFFFVLIDQIGLGSTKYGKSKGPLSKKGVQAIMIVSIIVRTLFLLAFSKILFRSRKRKARDRRSKSLFNFTTSATYLEDSQSGKGSDEVGISDLPCFDLKTIAAAIDNFSDANKLGEGGFGSVYKGLLYGEKEIAVKRLSKYSGQGNEEFKNEVTLIAKLQHRNLVRVLGYCIQEREKMLIYEFLPNKSLDSFIFGMSFQNEMSARTRIYNCINALI
ncbi:LOW QUALITY PROTEIN: G-type lectin S-receptor-like serine/threonine-protein kinase RKS1 [Hevea brasiliensis]|uniref:LOW QUALITY PROTEIN: G-type lectin S-receptor-like serine/threonine-protein kinase RKS1 n=1 Tax=Hevea brasiliensis TaxID=3981 RepID=UPI0025D31758|nr:LOW QUALITY PROTEIN: G-type lectin S-receptor-like serine/threonine-protein kinase RKS1 [Hevea brasiliensis]